MDFFTKFVTIICRTTYGRREIRLMLKKLSIICLFTLTITGLIACSTDNPTSTDEESPDVETKESEEAPEEKELVEPDNEETQQLVIDTINNIHKVMREEVDKVGYWETEKEYKENAKKISENAEEPLKKYIAKPSINKYAEEIAEVMTCQCDSMLTFRVQDAFAGFKITDFSENTFKAESITVNETGLDEIGWKSNWSFVKEDGDWKLREHTYTFPDYPDADEPVDKDKFLNFTFEDIEKSFRIYDSEREEYTEEYIPIEFVEEFEDGGVRYLVIQMPDETPEDRGREPGMYIVYNTELGIEDIEFTEEYND